MSLNSKIKRIGFPNPIFPDEESRNLHEKLIKENWTYKKQPNSKTFLKQRRGNIDHTSRNVVWDSSSVTHLLKRATMGSSIDDINYFINQGLEDSIIYILADQELPAPPGDWVEEELPNWNVLSPEQRQEIIQVYHNRMKTLQKWWAQIMIGGGSNITEMMTLFWHNYFASAYSKVFYPQAMYQQNNIFRKNCMGNFKDLLRQVTFGPAMMIWLDISHSKKEAPNENFARELMELFTLGVDNYSQDDVVAASRAFTGYITNGLDTNYDFENMEGWGPWWTNWHDFDDKTFMGQTGPWTGDDIINIILDQNNCANHICKKIYQWFLYNELDMNFIDEMANVLRTNNYEIKSALEYFFSSDHFYNSNFAGSNIQNPIQLYLGSLKRLKMDTQPFDINFFREIQNHLGMILFEPPDVNGWVGYRSWINSNTLPLRKAMLCALVDHQSPFGNFGNYIDVPLIASSLVNENNDNYHIVQIIDNLSLIFLGIPIEQNLKNQLLDIALDGAEPYDWNINLPAYNSQWNRMKDLLKHMIRLPEFQLS